MTEPVLLSQWAACGIAAGAARFLPVPLLDDVVRRRAAQTAVVRTLRAHGRRYASDLVEPLWADADGAHTGVRGRLEGVPTRLLLFPVRKYTALFGAVTGVPNDVARVVLLARAVERRLERGELSSPDRLTDEATALRAAVDEAIDGMDLRLLTAALADGLTRSRGLTTAAVAFARQRLATADPDERIEADGALADGALADGALADGAERVTEVLRRPEVNALLERFDAQVDSRLGRRS